MEDSVTAHYINKLKTTIVLLSGLTLNEPEDCAFLQKAIIKVTGNFISLLVLQRLLGFAVSKFYPSRYDLDTLSRFCGYQNWKLFCGIQ